MAAEIAAKRARPARMGPLAVPKTICRLLGLTGEDAKAVHEAWRGASCVGDANALLRAALVELSKSRRTGEMVAADFVRLSVQLSAEIRAVTEAQRALGPQLPTEIRVVWSVKDAPEGCGDKLVSA